MDAKRIIPITIIAIAVLSLVAYYALSPAVENTPVLPSQTGVAQTPIQGAQGTTGTTLAQVATEPPADVKPVSSKDPATVVPDKMTLNEFCDAYYKAWLKKDWQACFDMQPFSKKEGSNVKSFGESRDGYGLVSFELDPAIVKGNAAVLKAKLELGQNGGMDTVWTFVKNDKGQWVAFDTKTMMGVQ